MLEKEKLKTELINALKSQQNNIQQKLQFNINFNSYKEGLNFIKEKYKTGDVSNNDVFQDLNTIFNSVYVKLFNDIFIEYYLPVIINYIDNYIKTATITINPGQQVEVKINIEQLKSALNNIDSSSNNLDIGFMGQVTEPFSNIKIE